MKIFSFFLAVGLLISGCSSRRGSYDLSSKSISYEPSPVYVGDKVVFTYTSNNTGTDTIFAKSYQIEFYVDGKLVSFDRATPDLEPGGEITLTKSAGYWHFEAKVAGTYEYKLVLDPKNTLRETNEHNNVVTGTIVVLEKGNPTKQ